MDLLFRELKSNRPADIQARIGGVKKLDFSNSAVTSLKPVQFFVALKKLDLANTRVQDLRPLWTLSQLERIDISGSAVTTLKPLMIYRDRLRVTARSHRLRDARELEAFRR